MRLLPLLALLAGCTSPPEHFTRLWIEGQTGSPLVGTSTEDGVLMLTEPDWKIGDRFEIQFPIGNSLVVDKGRIDRLNDTVAVIKPISSRLREGRFAASMPEPGEKLYVALRNEVDEPLMAEAELWKEGAWGDWLVLPSRDANRIAADYAGTGVYVEREDRWEIVGVLAGLTAQDENSSLQTTALGFISLSELARILPDHFDYFEHDVKPLRPDFEYGVPLQPGELEPVFEEAVEEPKAPPEPLDLVPIPKLPGQAAGAGKAGAAGKGGKPVPKSKAGKGKAGAKPGAKPGGKPGAQPPPKGAAAPPPRSP
jgi:hypothetical protein